MVRLLKRMLVPVLALFAIGLMMAPSASASTTKLQIQHDANVRASSHCSVNPVGSVTFSYCTRIYYHNYYTSTWDHHESYTDYSVGVVVSCRDTYDMSVYYHCGGIKVSYAMKFGTHISDSHHQSCGNYGGYDTCDGYWNKYFYQYLDYTTDIQNAGALAPESTFCTEPWYGTSYNIYVNYGTSYWSNTSTPLETSIYKVCDTTG